MKKNTLIVVLSLCGVGLIAIFLFAPVSSISRTASLIGGFCSIVLVLHNLKNWKWKLMVILVILILCGAYVFKSTFFIHWAFPPKVQEQANKQTDSFILPQAGDQWVVGETHIIKISQPRKTFYPFTDITLNKRNGEFVGIIACKIGGDSRVAFDWDARTVMTYCGAGPNETRNKDVEPGSYLISVSSEDPGRPVIFSSGVFSIVR